jgi:hypothetical protein
VFTPINAAAVGLNDNARIANPSRVRITTHTNPSNNTPVDAITTTCVRDNLNAIPTSIDFASTKAGNPFGCAPNTSCPPYSKNSDTPIAVIKTVNLGLSRNGL